MPARVKALIADNIRFFRKRRGLRQADLAEKIALGHRHVQKIEGGNVDLKSTTLVSIAKSLSVRPCRLLGDCGNLPPLLRDRFGCPNEILDTLHAGVMINDTEGKILYANKTHRNTLGMGELTAEKPWYVFDTALDDAEVARMKSTLTDVIQNRPAPTPYYTKKRLPNGEIIPVKFDWRYLLDEKDEIVGFLSLVFYHSGW